MVIDERDFQKFLSQYEDNDYWWYAEFIFISSYKIIVNSIKKCLRAESNHGP